MKRNIFDRLKQSEFSLFSSFAVWNENDNRNLSIFESSISELHTDVILVGLNAVRTMKKFQNFHYFHQGNRDLWLVKTIGRGFFRGCYLTDILKYETASSQSKINFSSVTLLENMKRFRKELSLLEEKNPVIVCFGKKAFKILSENGFNPLYVKHWAGRISFESFCESLSCVEKEIMSQVQ